MTSKEWRSDPSRIRETRKLFDDPLFKEMLAIVRDEPPSNTPLPSMGSDSSDKVMAYGMELGYRNCLAKLLILGAPIPKEVDLTPTYSEPHGTRH